MTLLIQGFVQHSACTNNANEAISPIGELSNLSKTFTVDQARFTDALYDGLDLTVFSSKDGANVQLVDQTKASHVLNVANATFTFLEGKTLPIVATTLINSLNVTFAGVIEDVVVGDISAVGTHRLPQWMEWKLTGQNTTFKIWFSDVAFQQQFQEFTIKVVCPLVSVNNFLLASATVKSQLAADTPSALQARINTTIGDKPPTITQVLSFNYTPQGAPNDKTPSTWAVVCYGAAGDNLDKQKEAIAQWILTNSAQPQSVWEDILAEIFRNTEFQIFPRWDRVAISATTMSQPAVYSPTVVSDSVTTTQSYLATKGLIWTQSELIGKIHTSAHVWGSVALIAVATPDNSAEFANFQTAFPDYIAVGTSSPDFSRMSARSQALAIVLNELLASASSATLTSILPTGIKRVLRGSRAFLMKSTGEVNILVDLKANP